MPAFVTQDGFGVYAYPLTISGYTCTLNFNLGTGFLLSFNFTSMGGYTIYPEVSTATINLKLMFSEFW